MTERFVFNPFDPAFVDDPIPALARGRAEYPLYRHPGLPLVSVFRYHDVQPVLRDVETWSSRFPPPPNARDLGLPEDREQSMLGQDPPEHDRLRGFVFRRFTPRRIARLGARIREIARGLLEQAVEKRTIDFVEALSYPLPVIVIAELIGVPPEDRERFRIWSDTVVENLGEGIGGTPLDAEGVRRRLRVAAEMSEYFAPLIEARRGAPRDDLLTHLACTERGGDRLSHQEILTMLTLLLIAGNETTRNLLGNAVIQLLAHPDELRRLREDRGLLRSAVDEVLRFDSSVQCTVRRAKRPTRIRGNEIREGESALLWLSSANRDGSVFPDPDRFDVARDPNPHLAFGFGVHYCLGSNLARLEARVTLDELLERTRSFQRTDADPLPRNRSFILRGPKRLPLELVPA